MDKEKTMVSVPVEFCRDERMSARTKGVLMMILSCEQKERNMETLAKLCHLSVPGLRKDISRLEELGYLSRKKKRKNNLFVGWEWEVLCD